MKKLIYILALLLVAISVVMIANKDPGYVLIAYGTRTTYMSLVFFIPAVLFGFILLYFLLRLIGKAIGIPHGVARWRQLRQTDKARKTFTRGLTKLAEGEWSDAESAMLAHVRHSENPVLNYLGAAFAAQGHNRLDKRDDYLSKAYELTDGEETTVNMVQALLQHMANQPEQALATLMELKKELPKNQAVLKLQMLQNVAMGDWTTVADSLPALKRNKVLTEKEIEALNVETHKHLLQLHLPEGSENVLKKTWQSLPKSARKSAALIALYARQLISQSAMQEAETLVRESLEQGWDEALAEIYGLIVTDEPLAQFEQAEQWLADHKQSAALLLTLGRLAMQNQLWGKSMNYLEQCLAIKKMPDAYHIMGQLHEQQNNQAQALECYREGLGLASGAR